MELYVSIVGYSFNITVLLRYLLSIQSEQAQRDGDNPETQSHRLFCNIFLTAKTLQLCDLLISGQIVTGSL